MACKTCGSSPCGCGNQRIPTGRNGRDGSQWYSGSGAPAASLGQSGDWYVDESDVSSDPTSIDIYQKIAGVWTFVVTIESGTDGAPGDPGAAGKTPVTETAAQFNMPNADGSSVAVVTTLDTSSINPAYTSWLVPGSIVYVQFAGFFRVFGVLSSTSFDLINLRNDSTGFYSTNAAPGTVIPAGSMIITAGPSGPAGPGSTFDGDYNSLTNIPTSFNPTGHHVTHEAGGSDQVKVTEPMLQFTDITLANASTTKHGLLPKLSGNVAQGLRGDGTWGANAGYTDEQAQDAVGGILVDSSTVDLTYNDATPYIKADVIPAGIKLDALGSPDDTSTLNSTILKHGLLRKLSGTSGQYLDGNGNWTIPAGTGSVTNYPDLADVEAISGSPYETIQVNHDGTGLVNRLVSSPTIDIGAMFNLRPKDFVNMDNIDQCGPDLGLTASDFQDIFPNYYEMLSTDLGWSDPEILALTYFTAALNEVALLNWVSGTWAFSRYKLAIPAGKHWYNSELRVGQSIVEGQGAFYYFGNGNTEIARTDTGWKSIYGAQNDGVYLGFCPYTYAGEAGTSGNPVALGGGANWCHGFQIRDLCMTGTCGEFNDFTYREAGINYWGAGENSGVFNCLLALHNDFGILTRAQCAYANGNGNSFFNNGVGGIGLGGVARSTINMSASGDFNPFMFYTFRCGETLTAPNALTNVTDTTAGYTQPGVSSTVPVSLTSVGILKVGDPLYIVGGGYYEITAIVGTTVTLENLGTTGNAAPTTVIAGGAVVQFPYFPTPLSGDPGGNITVPYLKLESFTCGDLIAGYTACASGAQGKGQMLARLSGRFHFKVMGGTATVHEGICNSLVRVEDDSDNGGSIPLDNSTVHISDLGTVRWAYWLHDVKNDVKWVANDVDDDTHGTGIKWTNNYLTSTTNAFDPLRDGFTMTNISATWKPIQPPINDGAPFVYNETTGPSPGDGYDTVTGTLY